MAAITSTVLAVSAGLSAVAGGLSAYSQYQEGKSQAAIQRQNADMQAKMLAQQNAINESNLQTQRNQAQALDRQQEQVLATAAENRKRIIQEKVRLEGAQRVGAAKGGVVTTGTPLALFADTEFEYDRKTNDLAVTANADANAIGQEAALRRKGFEIEAINLSTQRKANRQNQKLAYQSASATERRGTYGAVGTLLSTGSEVAGYYGDYVKSKPVKQKSSTSIY